MGAGNKGFEFFVLWISLAGSEIWFLFFFRLYNPFVNFFFPTGISWTVLALIITFIYFRWRYHCLHSLMLKRSIYISMHS